MWDLESQITWQLLTHEVTRENKIRFGLPGGTQIGLENAKKKIT